MTVMKKLLFIFLLAGNILVICYPTRAQQQEENNNRWQFVGRNDSGSSFFLDKSVQKQTGGIRRTWSKQVFGDGSYKIGLVDWQCRARKFRILEGATFNRSGEYIYREDKPTGWISVFPDSVSESYFNVVCASTGRTSVVESNKLNTGKIAQVIALDAYIRESPNASSRVIQKVEKGVRLLLADADTASTNGWYQVFIPETNETGWLRGSHIELLAGKARARQPRQKSNPKSKPTTDKRGGRAN